MPLEDWLLAVLGLSNSPSSNNPSPIGAAVLVDTDLALTCAHVVNTALGRDQMAKGRPSGKIRVRHHARPNEPVWARVDDSDDAWRAPPAEDHLGADLCLLRIIDEWSQPPPRARLYDFEVILQREFRAGGFPKGWDIDFAEGRVIGKDAVGLYLLRPDPVVAAVVSTGAKAHRWFSEDQRSPGI